MFTRPFVTLSLSLTHVFVCPFSEHCRLHYFLQDYVEDNFLERVRYESFTKMGACVKRE